MTWSDVQGCLDHPGPPADRSVRRVVRNIVESGCEESKRRGEERAVSNGKYGRDRRK